MRSSRFYKEGFYEYRYIENILRVGCLELIFGCQGVIKGSVFIYCPNNHGIIA